MLKLENTIHHFLRIFKGIGYPLVWKKEVGYSEKTFNF